MGASQSYGKVLNTKPEFVQNPDNAEVLKLFKNKDDLKWYTKDNNGNISLFKPCEINYREFNAIISQNETDPPYIDDIFGDKNFNNQGTPFLDTIGGVFSIIDYFGSPAYLYTKEGAFANNDKISISLSDNRANLGYNVVVSASKYDDNSIIIRSGRYSIGDTNQIAYSNSLMYNQLISIKIYN